MTTVYDDCELYALSIVRACVDETEQSTASAHIIETYNEVANRHGAEGVGSLVAALGRFAAMACVVQAINREMDVHELLDDFTMHKIEQQQADGEV